MFCVLGVVAHSFQAQLCRRCRVRFKSTLLNLSLFKSSSRLFVKFGNFDHLRINDGEMNLVQYLCLDIVLVWSLVFILLLAGLVVCAR
jgi:hypothetical protein